MKRTVVRVSLVAIIGSIFAFLALFQACGPAESPPPVAAVGQPAPVDTAYVAIAPLIKKDCGTCHADGGIQKPFDAARFKSSKAKARLVAGTMPPGGKIDAVDKAKLLTYLGGN